MTYLEALRAAMTSIVEQGGLITGQSVAAGGTALRRTTDHLPPEALLELPVAEDMQLGMATGIALAGRLVLTCYPRWNFLLLATNQLVNHLDKIPAMSGVYPKVLIRVSVPQDTPLNPGHQHLGNYTDAIASMLTTVKVFDLHTPEDVTQGYQKAFSIPGSFLLVEHARYYDA